MREKPAGGWHLCPTVSSHTNEPRGKRDSFNQTRVSFLVSILKETSNFLKLLGVRVDVGYDRVAL